MALGNLAERAGLLGGPGVTKIGRLGVLGALVSHLVDGDQVIVRADRNAPITSELAADAGTVVAYEADAVDSAEHVGWSVTLVGVARQAADPDEAAAFRRALHHWADGGKDQIIAIHPGMVTGCRLAADGTVGSSEVGSAVR